MLCKKKDTKVGKLSKNTGGLFRDQGRTPGTSDGPDQGQVEISGRSGDGVFRPTVQNGEEERGSTGVGWTPESGPV